MSDEPACLHCGEPASHVAGDIAFCRYCYLVILIQATLNAKVIKDE